MVKCDKTGRTRVFVLIVLIAGAVIIAVGVPGLFYSSKTIFDLFRENQLLTKAISSLTEETQIGYAKVLAQETRDGKLYTRLLVVETDRSDPLRRVLEKQYEIEGDVVHFDALIVTFVNQFVMDGRERSLYLWRRVYGESMKPEEGYPIETPGGEPKRYADICAKLSLKDRDMFWEEIWELSNDPDRLREAGIKAIYGNVIYRKLKPGLIYVFKISNTGALFPEVVPDL